MTRDMNKFTMYKSDIDKDQYKRMSRVLEDTILQIYDLFDKSINKKK